MAGAPIISLPYTAKVGRNQTTLFFQTSTQVTQDTQGKVNGGITTLNYSSSPNNYVPAAITKDGGKTWEYLKDSKGEFILGADARKSLQEGVLKNNTNAFIKKAAQKAGVPETQAKNLQLNQNTASTNAPEAGSTGEQQGGDQATKEQQTTGAAVLSTISSQITDSKKTRDVRQYPSPEYLRYPVDINTAEQDSIRFTMLKYSPRKASVSGISKGEPFEKREGQTRDRGSTVILPIQSGISDSNTVSWNRNDMDASSAIAAVAALSGIKEGGSGLIESLKSGSQLLQSENANIKEAIAAYFAEQAAQVQGLLTRTTGAIINPNAELLFNGPELRTFSFNITMSAREEKESKNIRNIIRFFKQGMSVKRASTELFLKSPNTFEIKYYYKNTPDHPWINKIKECALTGCNVSYTPAQTYSTYSDGAMTMYEMLLQFTELEPVYDDDYSAGGGKGNESQIGY